MSDIPDATTVSSLLNSRQHRAGLNDLSLEVTAVTRRHPWLARVTGTVPGMSATDPAEWTHPNLAVRLAIPDAADPLGPLVGQEGLCRRVYTLAAVDHAASTVDIDIMIHGGTSPMMRWVAGLTPGARVDFAGPRPHPAPTDATPGSRVILLADGSAYPAASAITRALPVTTVVLSLPEAGPQVGTGAPYTVDFPGAEVRAASSTGKGSAATTMTPLADALASLQVTSTDTVWAAGEREDMRAVRARLREAGLPKEQMQVFGYWRRGKTGTDVDMARLQGIAELQKQGRTLVDDFEIEI